MASPRGTLITPPHIVVGRNLVPRSLGDGDGKDDPRDQLSGVASDHRELVFERSVMSRSLASALASLSVRISL
jgi:hypothetical protein